MRVLSGLSIIDRYVQKQVLAAMGGTLGVVISLMVLEHLPRMVELTRWSGRRSYVIGQTVAGLLPEYIGIGLMVGLFLGIALTVRKLSMRGELYAMAACGISTKRLMRLPFIFAVIVALATLLNQGWLMPSGESRLAEIGRKMQIGEFGQRLPSDQFLNLGSGAVLHFKEFDESKGAMIEMFLKTGGRTFTAARGRMWFQPSGQSEIELLDGQVFFEDDGRVLNFDRLRQQVGVAQPQEPWDVTATRVEQLDILTVWAGGTRAGRAAVYGRCLTAFVTLLLPLLAIVLGKPPRLSSGGSGLIIGLILLTGALKLIAPLTAGKASSPEASALVSLLICASLPFALLRCEQTFGEGFVDRWALRPFALLRPLLARQKIKTSAGGQAV